MENNCGAGIFLVELATLAEQQLDLGNLGKGIYFYSLSLDGRDLGSRKLLRE